MPRTGKTILLQNMARGIHANYPNVQLILLLIDERPEEVTDMRRNVPGTVYASSNDNTVEKHIDLAQLIIERCKRQVEYGADIVVLLDRPWNQMEDHPLITRLSDWREIADIFDKGSSGIIEARSPADIDAARGLFQDYASSLDFNLDFQDFAAELENLPGGYAPPEGCILLAQEAGRSVGCVVLRKLDSEACEMKRLYVRPEARGRGIGRKLAEAVIMRAKEIGYRRIRLDTVKSMKAANSLYASLGFTRIAPYRFNPLAGAEYYELELSR